MTTTATLENGDATVHPAMDSWTISPSGGDLLCAVEQLESTEPDGALRGCRAYVLHDGLVFRILVLTADWGGGAAASHEFTDALGATLSRTPSLAPRRLDERPAADAEGRASATAQSGDEATGPAAGNLDFAAADELIDAIQDALSLSVTQIADILGVSRATVHAWIRGDVLTPRSAKVAQRLRDLQRVGKLWRERSAIELGRLVTVPLGDDQASLFDLLRASTWKEERIDHAIAALARQLEMRRTERRDARTARGEPPARSVTPETVELERQRSRALMRRGRYYGR